MCSGQGPCVRYARACMRTCASMSYGLQRAHSLVRHPAAAKQAQVPQAGHAREHGHRRRIRQLLAVAQAQRLRTRRTDALAASVCTRRVASQFCAFHRILRKPKQIHTRARAHTHKHTRTHTHTHTHTHARAHAHARMHARTHTHDQAAARPGWSGCECAATAAAQRRGRRCLQPRRRDGARRPRRRRASADQKGHHLSAQRNGLRCGVM